MKRLLQLEQVAQLALGVVVLWKLPHIGAWWVYLLLFFAPDLGMIGYLVNTRVGAWCYNILHHKLSCVLLISAGYFLGVDAMIVIGVLFYAHACFDRVAGYGLKYEDSFGHTHLGMVGKKKV